MFEISRLKGLQSTLNRLCKIEVQKTNFLDKQLCKDQDPAKPFYALWSLEMIFKDRYSNQLKQIESIVTAKFDTEEERKIESTHDQMKKMEFVSWEKFLEMLDLIRAKFEYLLEMEDRIFEMMGLGSTQEILIKDCLRGIVRTKLKRLKKVAKEFYRYYFEAVNSSTCGAFKSQPIFLEARCVLEIEKLIEYSELEIRKKEFILGQFRRQKEKMLKKTEKNTDSETSISIDKLFPISNILFNLLFDVGDPENRDFYFRFDRALNFRDFLKEIMEKIFPAIANTWFSEEFCHFKLNSFYLESEDQFPKEDTLLILQNRNLVQTRYLLGNRNLPNMNTHVRLYKLLSRGDCYIGNLFVSGYLSGACVKTMES